MKHYTLNSRSALVLEGGGMRGVFTCGVLDNLMDRGIAFPYAIGVSAGACNGLSYMSHQRGRAKFSNIASLSFYYPKASKQTKLAGLLACSIFDAFPSFRTVALVVSKTYSRNLQQRCLLRIFT